MLELIKAIEVARKSCLPTYCGDDWKANKSDARKAIRKAYLAELINEDAVMELAAYLNRM